MPIRILSLFSLLFMLGCEQPKVDTPMDVPVEVNPKVTTSGTLKVGDLVPAMSIPVLFQAEGRKSISLKELQGKTTVIEFWATWCAPCIVAVDHLNAVANEFSNNDDVCFISLTSEQPSVVEDFIKRLRMNTWVGVDESREIQDAFHVSRIPRTVIINKEGIVAANIHPSGLTTALLEAIIAGDLHESESTTATVRPQVEANDFASDALVQILLREAANPEIKSGASSRNKRTLLGYSSREIIRSAFGIRKTRELIDTELPEVMYDLIASFSNTSPSNSRTLQHAVAAAFQVEVKTERRETPVIVFSLGENMEHRLKHTVSNGGALLNTNRTKVKGVNIPLSDALNVLEAWAEKPIVDETGIDGRFDFAMARDENDSYEQLCNAFADLTGLEWREGVRELEVSVVTRSDTRQNKNRD